MADYGFKISKAGYDVKTATDDQLVMTSKLNSQKISPTLQGTVTQSIPASSTVNIQITHDLGYIPAFDAWYENELGHWKSPFSSFQLDGDGAKIFTGSSFGHYINSTILNLVIDNSDASTAHDVTFYYIIFLNPT